MTTPKTFHWRIGRRTGQSRWQIKQPPNWRVAHQVDTLEEAAAWLTALDVNLSTVSVLISYPWPTLAELLKK